MSRTIRVRGGARVAGSLAMPGDKSISHRVAMLASVANGASVVHGFATSADCRATLGCVGRLGVAVERAGEALVIRGNGLRGYAAPAGGPLDAGNSGSTIRMLSGLLAAQGFRSVIDGDDSLRRRPMGRIIEPLTEMGAKIMATDRQFAPLVIEGAPLSPVNYQSRVASAQVKTCVLFAGLYADGVTYFSEPSLSRDHTELMLEEFGARFRREDGAAGAETLAVEGGAELNPVEYHVPGDLSSAAFFIAAATLLPGSELTIQGVGLNPTRTGFVDLMVELGAAITKERASARNGEHVGNLRVKSARLVSERRGTVISGAAIPNLIDEIPILAVAGTQLEGRLEVRSAGELRVKESDRIRTVVDGIRAMGGEIEEFEDGFAVAGPQRLRGGRVETAGDHRIAMAFTVAGLLAQGTTEIADADSANVSFPEFYDLLSAVTGEGCLEDATAR